MARAQLGTLSQFKVTGGTVSTYFSTLRRAGLITEQNGLIGLTDEGRAAAGVSAVAPASTAELFEQWRARSRPARAPCSICSSTSTRTR